MSAKKPRDNREHARGLWAWKTARISRKEYQMICIGQAFISGNQIWKDDEDAWGWSTEVLYPGRAGRTVNEL